MKIIIIQNYFFSCDVSAGLSSIFCLSSLFSNFKSEQLFQAGFIKISCQSAFRQSSGSYISGSHQAVIRQSLDINQAVAQQLSDRQYCWLNRKLSIFILVVYVYFIIRLPRLQNIVNFLVLNPNLNWIYISMHFT